MKIYRNLLGEFEELFLMHATLGIIASSCIGSAAAMFILMDGHSFINMVELFLVVTVCMGFNAAVLAQMKPKFVFNTLIVSLVTSVIFIAVNIL